MAHRRIMTVGAVRVAIMIGNIVHPTVDGMTGAALRAAVIFQRLVARYTVGVFLVGKTGPFPGRG